MMRQAAQRIGKGTIRYDRRSKGKAEERNEEGSKGWAKQRTEPTGIATLYFALKH